MTPLTPEQVEALTALELTVLRAWRGMDVGYGFGFNEAASRSGVDRSKIRRIVRSISRKGALEYCNALFWEDENRIGAGYFLTTAGDKILRCDDEAVH